jgi:hypothetical protein
LHNPSRSRVMQAAFILVENGTAIIAQAVTPHNHGMPSPSGSGKKEKPWYDKIEASGTEALSLAVQSHHAAHDNSIVYGWPDEQTFFSVLERFNPLKKCFLRHVQNGGPLETMPHTAHGRLV